MRAGMSCAARATRALTAPAATRSSIISGSFRSATMFAGLIAFTSRFCPPLRRAKVPVQWTDLTVRHTGYVDPALRARKLDRDIQILKRELEERPDDPFVLFNLGAIAVERHEWHDGARVPRAQPGRLGADRLDRAQAVCPDRPRPPDDGDSQAALRHVPRGLEARSRGRRVVVPQGGRASASGRIVRGRAMLAADLDAAAARSVLQCRSGDLWSPDPAQPGGPGRRARRSCRGPSGCGATCWPNAPAIVRRWRSWNGSRAHRHGYTLQTRVCLATRAGGGPPAGRLGITGGMMGVGELPAEMADPAV